jgi:alpha-tubulin suppressor-like RCC1 family protein
VTLWKDKTIFNKKTGEDELVIDPKTGKPEREVDSDKSGKQFVPQLVPRLPKIRQLISGANHTAVLSENGEEVFSWGRNDLGVLGRNIKTPDQPEATGDDKQDAINKMKYKKKKMGLLFPQNMLMPEPVRKLGKQILCVILDRCMDSRQVWSTYSTLVRNTYSL